MGILERLKLGKKPDVEPMNEEQKRIAKLVMEKRSANEEEYPERINNQPGYRGIDESRKMAKWKEEQNKKMAMEQSSENKPEENMEKPAA